MIKKESFSWSLGGAWGDKTLLAMVKIFGEQVAVLRDMVA